MKRLGRLDLTVEHIMLEPQFKELFTSQKLAAAQFRLDHI